MAVTGPPGSCAPDPRRDLPPGGSTDTQPDGFTLTNGTFCTPGVGFADAPGCNCPAREDAVPDPPPRRGFGLFLHLSPVAAVSPCRCEPAWTGSRLVSNSASGSSPTSADLRQDRGGDVRLRNFPRSAGTDPSVTRSPTPVRHVQFRSVLGRWTYRCRIYVHNQAGRYSGPVRLRGPLRPFLTFPGPVLAAGFLLGMIGMRRHPPQRRNSPASGSPGSGQRSRPSCSWSHGCSAGRRRSHRLVRMAMIKLHAAHAYPAPWIPAWPRWPEDAGLARLRSPVFSGSHLRCS